MQRECTLLILLRRRLGNSSDYPAYRGTPRSLPPRNPMNQQAVPAQMSLSVGITLP